MHCRKEKNKYTKEDEDTYIAVRTEYMLDGANAFSQRSQAIQTGKISIMRESCILTTKLQLSLPYFR